MEEEHWKNIQGWEGTYQISDLGRVKSLRRIISQPFKDRIKERVQKELILEWKTDGGGYKYIVLQKDKLMRVKKIARLVAQAFIPNPLNLPEVNHKDRNKSNNAKSNLEWTSAVDNTNHFLTTGELPSRMKFTREQIIYIRENFILGRDCYKEWSQLYNCLPKTIRKIVKKITWKFVK